MKGANASLQSLTIKGGNRAVNIYASGVTVVSCTAYLCYDTGINCDGSSNDTISGCLSYDNADTGAGGGNADGFGVKSASGARESNSPIAPPMTTPMTVMTSTKPPLRL